MNSTSKQDNADSSKSSDFDKDQPSENAGAPLHRGNTADATGDVERPSPSDDGAIPPLPEPNVEGVGNEGGD